MKKLNDQGPGRLSCRRLRVQDSTCGFNTSAECSIYVEAETVAKIIP